MVSGAYAHMLWGPHYLNRTPLALLRSLASLLVFTFADWSPLPRTPRCELDWSHALFVDAASQAHSFCYGIFGPAIGTRFGWCDGTIHNQQAAELFGLCAATRIAIHRGWKHLFLFGDNEASINQVLGLRASIGLKVQQRLLRGLSNLWARTGIQVWVYWLPSEYMPADPISRLFSLHKGCRLQARKAAISIFSKLRDEHKMQFVGRVGGFRLRAMNNNEPKQGSKLGDNLPKYTFI